MDTDVHEVDKDGNNDDEAHARSDDNGEKVDGDGKSLGFERVEIEGN